MPHRILDCASRLVVELRHVLNAMKKSFVETKPLTFCMRQWNKEMLFTVITLYFKLAG